MKYMCEVCIHTFLRRSMIDNNVTVICLISMTTVSLPLSIKLSFAYFFRWYAHIVSHFSSFYSRQIYLKSESKESISGFAFLIQFSHISAFVTECSLISFLHGLFLFVICIQTLHFFKRKLCCEVIA